MGFAESDHFLHAYASRYVDSGEPNRAIDRSRPDLKPVMLFLHAKLADEQQLRSEFTRVHVCCRFAMDL